jgi:DNA-binding CsgD family transcriptional regulator/sugar-specific transcriptional regulator TrmB
VATILSVLGLDIASEAVYQAMLGRSQSGLADLVASTGLPEADVRAALDKLAELTFIRPSRESPGGIRVVDPQVALDLVVRRQEAAVARQMQELASAREAAAAALAQYGAIPSGTITDSVERLMGLDAIQAKLEVLAAEVEHEALSVMPGGAQSQASLQASRPLDTDALSRGVALLTLYQDSVRNDRATYAYAQWLAMNGGEVRTAPLLPPRMVLFDRLAALVPIDPDNTKIGALCLREPGIVATLVATYQQAWATAVPITADQSTQAGAEPTEEEHALLVLLAQGLTDEAAAKRLGLGLRTVRRIMAGLMERLGASSRFEAGLKAAQRGWL